MAIDKLIINSAFREPEFHWKNDRNSQSFVKEPGRRPAGYFIAGQGSNQYNDIGEFVELPLVNRIRPRVKAWREHGYPGVTGITKKLLSHWNNNSVRQYPFFWCQLDAIETLIWLVEAPANDKVGIEIPSDGGAFKRICTKLCTGGGKTTVMAMLIAWMVCNKVTYPTDKRFTKYVFVVAPGLTVRSRLQVLQTGGTDNYYNQFNIVPVTLMDKLHQGVVEITNWQTLAWETEEEIKKRKSVDKRGAKSDEAYAREVLGRLKQVHNILVINDEAHHAWRKNPDAVTRLSKEEKDAEQEATVWIGGLDRINKVRQILTVYDFSATPFAPSGKKNDEEALFGWVVSDFGLNDGIESGLVKTPRVVVRDEGVPNIDTYKSRLYHIYVDSEVKNDIVRAAKPEEPLPDLINMAYYLLGKDWLELYKSWKEQGVVVPPVMITVANRTETAARIKYAFDKGRIGIDELCDPDKTLQIDSKVLADLEGDWKSKKDAAQGIREIVDTVGQKGKPGEQIRNVISVGMLSEGWDAKTVTHIMGLRAFSSQLLCEQVVGRGLRRTSYDLEEGSDMFTPEYVNIFGIPFTFLPHESDEQGCAPKTKPKTQVEVVPEKSKYELSWPNIVRLDTVYKQKLSINVDEIPELVLDTKNITLSAELAPILDGETDLSKVSEINLRNLDQTLRMQTIVFKASAEVYDQMAQSTEWQQQTTKFAVLGQVFGIVTDYIGQGRIKSNPPSYIDDPMRKRILFMLSMSKIVNHLWSYIKRQETETLVPIYDVNRRVLSTGDMATWFTTKPCFITKKCHISHCVCDSAWEASEEYQIEHHPHVVAWVKNDHIGFDVSYSFEGTFHQYRPDFLIKLDNGKILVLEVKGQEREKDKAKWQAMDDWIEAVNAENEFGSWCRDVSFDVGDLAAILDKHSK